jgi:hypothetical protein
MARLSLRTTALVCTLAMLGAGAVVSVVGRERSIEALFGPPDLGPASFETLRRRPSGNDALACPPGLCNAPADVVPPVFNVPARELRLAFGRMVQGEALVQLADADDLVPSERYVQRTPLLRFPDTIDVRFIDLPDGRSTLALYSRSQIGSSDMGVNRARIERWLAALARAVPQIAAASLSGRGENGDRDDAQRGDRVL